MPGFRCLELYVQREGHARPKSRHVERDFRLGAWVAGQRQAYRKGHLAGDRLRQLQSLPGWVWDTRAAQWEEGFAYLKRFVEREGYARVPVGHTEDGFRLGVWVNAQRTSHKQQRLKEERIARLHELPGWVWDARAAAWEEGFARLKGFVEREGHAQVPITHHEDGFPLGQWVVNQRGFKKRGQLTADRIKRLQDLPGWVWDTLRARWQEGLEHLGEYRKREGHAQVPIGHREDNFPLGRWVSGQRMLYKRGDLAKDQVRQLEAVPGWVWDVRKAQWENGLRHLKLFVEREGHAQVLIRHVERDFRLGKWIDKLRVVYKRGDLDKDRAKELEALPDWAWDARAGEREKWEDGLRRLKLFVEREGHARVPTSHVERDFPLGRWVDCQRKYHKRGSLLADRKEPLEELPGWVWNAREG